MKNIRVMSSFKKHTRMKTSTAAQIMVQSDEYMAPDHHGSDYQPLRL